MPEYMTGIPQAPEQVHLAQLRLKIAEFAESAEGASNKVLAEILLGYWQVLNTLINEG